MDTLFSLVPGWVIALLVLFVVGLIVSAGVAVFVFLFHVGVAINESRKPPHIDAGDYRLDQGRDVRPEARGREVADGGSHRDPREL